MKKEEDENGHGDGNYYDLSPIARFEDVQLFLAENCPAPKKRKCWCPKDCQGNIIDIAQLSQKLHIAFCNPKDCQRNIIDIA